MKQRMIYRMMLIVTILLNPTRLSKMEAIIAKKELEKTMKRVLKRNR